MRRKNSPGGCCCGVTVPPTGTVHFRVMGDGSTTPVAPTPYVRVLRQGSTDDVNEIQGVKFGGTITGGTFRLTFFGDTTAAIPWSSDNDTLAASVKSALEAGTTINAGQIVVTPQYMTAGIGWLFIEFIGSRGATSNPDITIGDNSLTGTGVTLTTLRHRAGTSARNAVQEIIGTVSIFSTSWPTGGTFKLEFDGQTTAAITWAMSGGNPNYTQIALNVKAALEALSNIAVGDVAVSGSGINSGVEVTFQGAYASTVVPAMSIADNSLTGTVHGKIAGASVTLSYNGVVLGTEITDSDGHCSFTLRGSGPGFTTTTAAAGWDTQTALQTPSNGVDAFGTLRYDYNFQTLYILLNPA